jgi:hypothetical protein
MKLLTLGFTLLLCAVTVAGSVSEERNGKIHVNMLLFRGRQIPEHRTQVLQYMVAKDGQMVAYTKEYDYVICTESWEQMTPIDTDIALINGGQGEEKGEWKEVYNISQQETVTVGVNAHHLANGQFDLSVVLLNNKDEALDKLDVNYVDIPFATTMPLPARTLSGYVKSAAQECKAGDRLIVELGEGNVVPFPGPTPFPGPHPEHK